MKNSKATAPGAASSGGYIGAWGQRRPALGVIAILANASPTTAQAMQQVPVLGSIAQLLTFRTYEDSQYGIDAMIQILSWTLWKARPGKTSKPPWTPMPNPSSTSMRNPWSRPSRPWRRTLKFSAKA